MNKNPCDVITEIIDKEYEKYKPTKEEIITEKKEKLLKFLTELIKAIIMSFSLASAMYIVFSLEKYLHNINTLLLWFIELITVIILASIQIIVYNALFNSKERTI